MSVTIDGVWIDDSIYWPLTHSRLVSNYSATANLHNLQITTATAKTFSAFCVFTSRSLATASNSADSLASRAQVPSSQTTVQNSHSCPNCLCYNILAQTNKIPASNNTLIVACVFVPRELFYLSRCLETVATRTAENTALLLLRSLHSNGRCYRFIA
jgi:hypothetical protein